ncbi:hypothetical protein KC336_g49 [Hortaea werneckii]|nr:hypothetical protein KC336_g49 [Hortaea werneckii]
MLGLGGLGRRDGRATLADFLRVEEALARVQGRFARHAVEGFAPSARTLVGGGFGWLAGDRLEFRIWTRRSAAADLFLASPTCLGGVPSGTWV